MAMESCSYLKLELYFYCFIILIFKGVVNVRNKSWRFGTLLSVLLIALLALGGCGGGPHNTPGQTPNPNPNPQPQVGVFENWKGEWKSANSAMNSAEVDSLCENVAKELPAYTKKGVKSVIGNMYRTDFVGMKIDGSTITFTDDKNGSLGTLTYVSRGVAQRKFGEEPLTWHQFEATSGASDKMKEYKHLVMLELGSDSPGGVKHFHMRYGSESFEALIDDAARAMWWPTFCKPESLSTLMKEMTTPEAVKAFVGMLQKINPLDGWKGTWKSAVTFLDDPAMAEVYKTLAEKASAAGKKTNTPEAVKNAFKVMLNSDFGGMKLEGNTVAILNVDGSVKETLSYTYDGIEERKFGEYPLLWSTFQAKSASSYKYLVMMPQEQHGTGPVHFHVRYGDKGIAHLLDTPALQGWWPTLCKEGTTAAKYAASMLEEADEMAGMLP